MVALGFGFQGQPLKALAMIKMLTAFGSAFTWLFLFSALDAAQSTTSADAKRPKAH